MQSLLQSKAPKESPWKAAILDWFWANIVALSIILATITSLSSLAFISIGPARAPVFLRNLRDASLELTGCLIGLYAFAFFFDLSRAKEFWMSKEMGFYSVVTALFFAAALDDLRLFMQNHRFERDVSKEMLALGLLWTSQFWKSNDLRDLLSNAVGFHRVPEEEPNEITGLGLSSHSKPIQEPEGK